MAKLSKMTELIADVSEKETPHDKTTRIVKKITEAEAEVRHAKTARLRMARLDDKADVQKETAKSANAT